MTRKFRGQNRAQTGDFGAQSGFFAFQIGRLRRGLRHFCGFGAVLGRFGAEFPISLCKLTKWRCCAARPLPPPLRGASRSDQWVPPSHVGGADHRLRRGRLGGGRLSRRSKNTPPGPWTRGRERLIPLELGCFWICGYCNQCRNVVQ